MKKPQSSVSNNLLNNLLWAALAVLSLGVVLTLIWIPQYPGVWMMLLTLLVADITTIGYRHRKLLSGRTAAHGINAVVYTLIVLGLIAMVNFVAFKHPLRLDLTQNKRHTLADQTIKILKDLKQPVKAALYFTDMGEKERARPLLENYRNVAPTKLELEYVDGKKEMIRAKNAGVTRPDTLVLSLGDKSSKVETPTEEKLTNALIKLAKDKKQTFCALTGHGEKVFSAPDENGYQGAQKGMESQGYTLQEFNLIQQKSVPANCDAIGIIGSTKAFFPAELDAIATYLDRGGRAIVAIDPILEGPDHLKELKKILESWYVHPIDSLILDDVGALMTRDLAVIMSQTVSKDHPITKDHDPKKAPIFFVAPRPLEAVSNAPAGMNIQWLAKSLQTAWAENDIASLKKGKVDAKNKKRQELIMAFAVEGKRPNSKATQNTRLVVFGSSGFATNGASRFGGNLDLFLNATSWTLEDENLISIRPKEEGAAKVAMSKQEFLMICLVTIILIPLAIVTAGVVIWLRRRKL